MTQAFRPHGVSIVMPAFNLGDTIGANIDRAIAAIAPLDDPELVVVDDGSVDSTRDAATAAAAGHDNVVVAGHSPNQGKGAALLAGFRASRGDTVVFLDGDLDLPPEQVPSFLETFSSSGADVLVGTKQASMEPGTYPMARRVLSRVFSGTIRLLFRLPVSETQTGLKAFRREALEAVMPKLRVKRYTYDLELIVFLHRAGFRIEEAPVVLSEGASSGGVSLRTLWEMGRDTLRIWFRAVVLRR